MAAKSGKPAPQRKQADEAVAAVRERLPQVDPEVASLLLAEHKSVKASIDAYLSDKNDRWHTSAPRKAAPKKEADAKASEGDKSKKPAGQNGQRRDAPDADRKPRRDFDGQRKPTTQAPPKKEEPKEEPKGPSVVVSAWSAAKVTQGMSFADRVRAAQEPKKQVKPEPPVVAEKPAEKAEKKAAATVPATTPAKVEKAAEEKTLDKAPKVPAPASKAPATTPAKPAQATNVINTPAPRVAPMSQAPEVTPARFPTAATTTPSAAVPNAPPPTPAMPQDATPKPSAYSQAQAQAQAKAQREAERAADATYASRASLSLPQYVSAVSKLKEKAPVFSAVAGPEPPSSAPAPPPVAAPVAAAPSTTPAAAAPSSMQAMQSQLLQQQHHHLGQAHVQQPVAAQAQAKPQQQQQQQQQQPAQSALGGLGMQQQNFMFGGERLPMNQGGGYNPASMTMGGRQFVPPANRGMPGWEAAGYNQQYKMPQAPRQPQWGSGGAGYMNSSAPRW